VVFVRGAEVGPTESIICCLVILAPYCVVMGALLPLVSLVLSSHEGRASIGQVYFLDNLGEILGGLLFSLVLVHVFDHFGTLYLAAVLNLSAAGLVALAFRRRLLLGASVAATAAWAIAASWFDLDTISTSIQYPGQRIVFKGNSPYGRLLVTETSGQYNFIENGVRLFSTENIEEVEQTIHYAMAQRPEAKRVLLIGGGISGTAREILKYPRTAVDYVELDPLIIKVAARLLPEHRPQARVEVINTDGRHYVRRTKRRYDAVLIDVPDPSTFQINRFYTREFFAEVKRILAEGGVLSLSLGHYENRLSEELAKLIAVAHRTLSEQFRNVLILPARRNYFLASDGPLTMDIAGALERHGIGTQVVSRRYLRGVLSSDRVADVRRAITEDAPLNQDFSPILYYYHLRYWMSQFSVRLGLLVAALAAILLAALVRIRPVSLAVFTTGLAASALEVVLLMAFQILYGCVYHQVGLIVTMFMVGLGLGSFSMNRLLARCGRRALVGLVFAVALLGAALPGVLSALGRFADLPSLAILGQLVILALTAGLGLLIGLEFPLAAKVDFASVAATAGRIYTADFLGAALGALVVSTLLIPLVGVTVVCLTMAAINLLSVVVLLCTSAPN